MRILTSISRLTGVLWLIALGAAGCRDSATTNPSSPPPETSPPSPSLPREPTPASSTKDPGPVTPSPSVPAPSEGIGDGGAGDEGELGVPEARPEREGTEGTPEAPLDVLKRERIGPLQFGLTEAELTKALGPPKSKSSPEASEATGEFVKTWNYPKIGLEIELAGPSMKGPFTVASVLASAPCTFATAKGIKVGSSLGELEKAYPRNAEESSDERYVYGSIFGGIVFEIDRGKVDTLFLGAAAE